MKNLIILLSTMLTINAYSQLGMSKKELDSKYGQPFYTETTPQGFKAYAYRTEKGLKALDSFIRCVIHKEKCITITYAKLTKFTYSQILGVMKENSLDVNSFKRKEFDLRSTLINDKLKRDKTYYISKRCMIIQLISNQSYKTSYQLILTDDDALDDATGKK